MGLFRRKKDDSYHSTETGNVFKFDDGQKVVLNSRGLIPVVLQDAESRAVLHLGYMDRRALYASMETRIVHIFRRSARQIERYGENAGLECRIESVHLHQSRRALLLTVWMQGDPDVPVPVTFLNSIPLKSPVDNVDDASASPSDF